MPTICHFEITADDVARAQKFYSELFGWKIEKFQESEMEYWSVITAEPGKGVNGGLFKRQTPEQVGLLNYIDVESIDDYSAKVEQLGGKIIMPKTPVPGMGWFVICLDTENNTFAIWQNDENAK